MFSSWLYSKLLKIKNNVELEMSTAVLEAVNTIQYNTLQHKMNVFMQDSNTYIRLCTNRCTNKMYMCVLAACVGKSE